MEPNHIGYKDRSVKILKLFITSLLLSTLLFINPSSVPSSGMGIISPWYQDGVYTVLNPSSNSPWVDVRAFGAKGDGITNDSTAIQNAINSIPIAGGIGERGKGGTVYFPKGIYLCNTGLINNGRKVSFIGDSVDNTTLKKGANNID